MTVPTFTSTRTDAAGRGAEFGQTWRAEIETSFARYLDLFDAYGASSSQVKSWGEQAVDRTAEWAPPLAEEIAGLATGSGLDTWQLGALNARTEILAAARYAGDGECSTSVVLPTGAPPRTVQTWDWYAAFRDGLVAWAFEPRARHQVRCFTEFGMLGKVGVNGAGLGVHFNILRHASDTDRIGVPVHAVARRLMDDAADVDEATAIARSARTSASTVITVVGYDGERASVRGLELCPAGLAEVAADHDGVFLHTNHFLDPDLAHGELTTPAESTSYARLDVLRARVSGLSAQEPIDRARAMNGAAVDEDGALCRHPEPGAPALLGSETLLTIGLDVEGGRLHFHRGGPCGVRDDSWQTF